MDENGSDKEQNRWEKDGDEVSFTKVRPIDVVFILEDEFGNNKSEEDKKYAIVKPVKVGLSGENYYEVQSAVDKEEMIVIGGYRILSKELNHGDLVTIKNQKKQSENGE